MIQLPRMNRGGQPYKQAVERTRALVTERTRYWSLVYGIPYRKIFIKKQKRRWGSASEAGNLNFNYRLGFLPPELLDYVVVHELCHLAHLNHSPAFWSLVSEAFPNPKVLDKKLNSYRF
jgi:predicted metal-dependent hydrolase